MILEIRLSPLDSPLAPAALTTVLRLVKDFPLADYYHGLRHTAISSVAANPV